MTLDINYTTTNPRKVDQLLEDNINAIAQTVAIVPSTRNSAGIIAAMQEAYALGGGTVQLENAPYTIDQEIPLLSGVSLVGVPGRFTFTGLVPDSNFVPTTGTIFNISAGVIGLSYNKDDQATTPANIGERSISRIRISNISFVGGLVGLIIGGMRDMGAMFSTFKDLYFFNQTGYHFSFENFMHCVFGRITGRNTLASGGGGMFFRCSLKTSELIPGNSQIVDEIYSYTITRTGRSIVFESRNPTEGCQMNEFVVLGRLQTNRFAGSMLTIAGTVVSGSADITVASGDLVNLPVGVPVGFAGSAPNFLDKDTTYYVVVNNGVDKIQISKNRAATSGQTITANGAVSLKTNGYPGVEIHGFGGIFTYCHFGLFNDIECVEPLTAISVNSTNAGCTFGISELRSQPTSPTRSIINLYAAGSINIVSSAHDLQICKDASSTPNFVYRHASARTLTGSTILDSSHNQCKIDTTSATAMNLTLNKGTLPFGAELEVSQLGAGQVTFVPGSNVTIHPAGTLKISGQYKRAKLRMIADDRYNGTETWLLTGDLTA